MAKRRATKEARRVRVQKSSGWSICSTCVAAAAMTWGFCLMWLLSPILFVSDGREKGRVEEGGEREREREREMRDRRECLSARGGEVPMAQQSRGA